MVDRHNDNKVATYSKTTSLTKLSDDLTGRATINRTSGALEITETIVTDDHSYTCHLQDTSSGTIVKETKLTITDGIQSSVIVEKGGRAILECPGFVPNPENEKYAIFSWYKARMAEIRTDNRVAAYDKSRGASTVLGDLQGRAAIDGTSGALEIPETRVADDHFYTCVFQDTASGSIKKETRLIITVTPKPKDLKIFGSGQVVEGQAATYTCSVSEMKPPPHQMYFRLEDCCSPLTTGIKENVTNEDGLTWNVSVEYKLIANRTHQGRKLQCVYVTSTNEAIISYEEREITVLLNLDLAVIILGSLLGISICVIITLAICLIYSCRRNTKQSSPKQTPPEQSTTQDPHHYYEIGLQKQTAATAHPAPPAGQALLYENHQATEAPPTYIEMK